MAADAFDRAFAAVVSTEGGYSNDPRDSGNYTPKGELRGTKYGISAQSYPGVDIANLTLEGAMAIYRVDCWDKVGGDSLPGPIALVVFDAAVNSGVQQSVKWLQGAVGVPADGVIGPITMAAIHKAPLSHVVEEFEARRVETLLTNKKWSTYGRGWLRRSIRMAIASTAMEDVA